MASTLKDWANLPDLVLQMIFMKLIHQSEYLHSAANNSVGVGAVCKSWRAVILVSPLLINDQNNETGKYLPLLIVPSDFNKNKRNLYCPITKRLLNTQLYVPYHLRCCRCSYGWLAFSTGRANRYKLILYNPLSGKEITDLPTMRIKNDFAGCRPDNFVAKVILSADPSVSPNDFYVAAFYGQEHELALLKFGEKSWRYIIEYLRRQVHLTVPGLDMIFHNGLLYIVSFDSKIATVDIKRKFENKNPDYAMFWNTKIGKDTHEPILPYPNQIICKTDIQCGDMQYLVESSQGDLLFVQKIHDNKQTTEFQVYKVVLPNQASNNNTSRVQLEKLASLGGDALFIGDNHSMAIPSTKRPPGCKPDTIYFSTGCVEWGFTLDTGVYNIKDGSYDVHYQQELKQQNMPAPIYIIPPPYFTSFITISHTVRSVILITVYLLVVCIHLSFNIILLVVVFDIQHMF